MFVTPYSKSWPMGDLKKLFPKIIRSLFSCEIIECNIQIDHFHMVMIILPKYKMYEVK